MPFLTIEHHGTRRGAMLNGRALIGRWASNEIVVDDPDVSRVHAWVAHAGDGQYVITDARSRSGTRVNGQAIGNDRCTLNDGDEIRIGPSLLTFGSGDALPEGIAPAPQPAQRADEQTDLVGILFDCVCRAPLWAPHALSGQVKRCHYCRQRIIIPSQTGSPAQLAAARRESAVELSPRQKTQTCSICQWTIDPSSDETATCPDCGLTFHAECWTENLGCSSYGCAQVNALASKDDKLAHDAADVVVEQPAQSVPWDTILLAASVTGSLLGVLLFGLPALIVVGAIAFYLYRGAGTGGLQRRGVITLASAVAIVGSIAGIAMSYWWWFI